MEMICQLSLTARRARTLRSYLPAVICRLPLGLHEVWVKVITVSLTEVVDFLRRDYSRNIEFERQACLLFNSKYNFV